MNPTIETLNDVHHLINTGCADGYSQCQSRPGSVQLDDLTVTPFANDSNRDLLPILFSNPVELPESDEAGNSYPSHAYPSPPDSPSASAIPTGSAGWTRPDDVARALGQFTFADPRCDVPSFLCLSLPDIEPHDASSQPGGITRNEVQMLASWTPSPTRASLPAEEPDPWPYDGRGLYEHQVAQRSEPAERIPDSTRLTMTPTRNLSKGRILGNRFIQALVRRYSAPAESASPCNETESRMRNSAVPHPTWRLPYRSNRDSLESEHEDDDLTQYLIDREKTDQKQQAQSRTPSPRLHLTYGPVPWVREYEEFQVVRRGVLPKITGSALGLYEDLSPPHAAVPKILLEASAVEGTSTGALPHQSSDGDLTRMNRFTTSSGQAIAEPALLLAELERVRRPASPVNAPEGDATHPPQLSSKEESNPSVLSHTNYDSYQGPYGYGSAMTLSFFPPSASDFSTKHWGRDRSSVGANCMSREEAGAYGDCEASSDEEDGDGCGSGIETPAMSTSNSRQSAAENAGLSLCDFGDGVSPPGRADLPSSLFVKADDV